MTPKTRGIAVVHYLGMPVDMVRVMEIAKAHNLFVLEDAALAIGGDSQRAISTDEFTTATSSDEIIQELYDNPNVKLLSSVKVTVEHQDQGGLALSLRESLIIEDLTNDISTGYCRVQRHHQGL